MQMYLFIYILSIIVIETFYQLAVRRLGDLGDIDGVNIRTVFVVVESIPFLNTVMAVIMVKSFFES